MKRLLLLAAVLSLGACASVAPLPEDSFYRLVAGADPAPLAAPPLAGTLFVELPRAAGVRRHRAMLFSEAPHVRFRQYNYHHWEEAPPQLVQHRLLDGLRALGVAETVTTRPTAAAAWHLETHLARFERLLEAGHEAALVELHVRLVAVEAPEAPLVEARYRAETRAADDTMEATARAFGAALDDVLARLAEDLAAALGSEGREAAR